MVARCKTRPGGQGWVGETRRVFAQEGRLIVAKGSDPLLESLYLSYSAVHAQMSTCAVGVENAVSTSAVIKRRTRVCGRCGVAAVYAP